MHAHHLLSRSSLLTRTRAGAAVFAIAVTAAGCISTPSTEPGATPAGAYALDPSHASLVWRVSHGEGLSMFTARFDRFEAALDFDPADPSASRVDVAIEAASVSTGMADFDDQVARAVFDAESHPEIRFTSTDVVVTGDTTAQVTGDLMFKGVTAPATLEVTYNGGARDPIRGADVVGFSAIGSVDRTAFGAGAYTNFGVGAVVELQIEAEFVKQ